MVTPVQSAVTLRRTYPIYVTVLLFTLIVGVRSSGARFAFVYGYTWLDWTMFGLLYMITGSALRLATID